MKIKTLAILGLLLLSFLFLKNFIYKSHRDIQKERAVLVNPDSLHYLFSSNQEFANKHYNNKILEINGVIHSFSENYIVIKPSLIAQIDSTFIKKNLTIGDSITIKARCIGYDDLFGEVKLDKTIQK